VVISIGENLTLDTQRQGLLSTDTVEKVAVRRIADNVEQ
jgi:hypothetical protein